MLLKLSRAAFWLAASAAAVALWVPTGRETLLTGVALGASAAAFLLWRNGVRQHTRDLATSWQASQASPLGDTALSDAVDLIEHAAAAAPTFEAALHAVARLLKAELGAREVVVREVLEIGPTHVSVATLVESQPGLRFDDRRIRVEASALGRCVARQCEDREPGTLAVPIVRDGRVVATLELAGTGIAVEPVALARVLALSRRVLGEWAPKPPPVALNFDTGARDPGIWLAGDRSGGIA